jgi:phosphoribosylaminoimidazole-succinocarboxamide synthase
LAECEKLPEPLFTPSTKAEAGQHDENIHPSRGWLIYPGWRFSVADYPVSFIWWIFHFVSDPCIEAAEIIGAELAEEISRISIELYKRAAEHALSRGVILADTKFEFGIITPPTSLPSEASSTSPSLILIDEVLTPDSSRYWPTVSYVPGRTQPSFDKQFLRDWLVADGFRKGLEDGPEGSAKGTGWTIAEEVVRGTASRYEEAMNLLMT